MPYLLHSPTGTRYTWVLDLSAPDIPSRFKTFVIITDKVKSWAMEEAEKARDRFPYHWKAAINMHDLFAANNGEPSDEQMAHAIATWMYHGYQVFPVYPDLVKRFPATEWIDD